MGVHFQRGDFFKFQQEGVGACQDGAGEPAAEREGGLRPTEEIHLLLIINGRCHGGYDRVGQRVSFGRVGPGKVGCAVASRAAEEDSLDHVLDLLYVLLGEEDAEVLPDDKLECGFAFGRVRLVLPVAGFE